MRRVSGLKDTLKTVFKSKKDESNKTAARPSYLDSSPPQELMLPRSTDVRDGASVVSLNIPGSNGHELPHDKIRAQGAPPMPPGGDRKRPDLWAEAYREFEAREPELASDFAKHLSTIHGGADAGDVLSNVASTEPLVDQLLKDRCKKQWRIPLLEKDVKIRGLVEKLTKFFLWSDGIVKQAVSAQPYAALAWSGVSVLLPLITQVNVQQEAMLGGFEYISHLQMYWRIFEEHDHESDGDILKQLTVLYSHIVEYQALVICHLSSAQLSRAWQKVTDLNGWEGKKGKIEELDNRCRQLVSEVEKMRIQRQRDLQLHEMQESTAILANIRQGLKDIESQAEWRYQDEQETALLRDLSSDYEHYKNINPLRADGTCEWLLSGNGFRSWRESSSSNLLWVSAGPGCGKSVLTRCLIDEGRLTTAVTTSTVCYFFFQNGVDGQMDMCSALSAILHQLFTQDSTGALIKLALAGHRQHGEKLKTNFVELWRILLACANAPTSGEIICVLDALDECSEESREKLFHVLDTFFTTHSRWLKLKFFITSRPYDDLEAAFRLHSNRSSYIQVDGDDQAHEINLEINVVIDMKLQEFAGDFSENHRQKLSERLKTMENRTYLWLHLTFDIIKSRRAAYSKPSHIQALLDSVPSRLSEAYDTILSHNSQDPENHALTRALLHLVLAASRPLTLQEANYALTLAGSGQFTSHKLIEDDLWPSGNFKSVVKNLSGLFINVYDSKISFIHVTAREYLMDAKMAKGEWQGRFRIAESHAIMSSVCMRYLSVVDVGILTDDDETTANQYPFVPYSSKNWTVHYNSQHNEGRQRLCPDARKLCDTSKGRGERLAAIFSQSELLAWSLDDSLICTDLVLASNLGLEPVVELILHERGTQADTGFADYGMALNAAVIDGRAGVVRTLLESTGDVRHREANNEAFGLAIIEGHVNAVEVLLDHGGEIHPVRYEVMEHVMGFGGKEMITLLLERLGDEIRLSQGLVELAASNFNYGADVMEVLLEKRGAEVQMAESVVEAAARNSRSAKEVMEVLLDRRGDEVEITENVLMKAAANGECGMELVTLLIENRGIRVTEDVLSCAVNNHGCGRELMALLLEQPGVEITGKVVDAAAGNRLFGDDLLMQLVRKRNTIPVTARTVEVAAANIGRGVEVMALLLSQEDDVPVTTEAMVLAAGNARLGKEVTGLLLKSRDGNQAADGGVLAAAAAADKQDARTRAPG